VQVEQVDEADSEWEDDRPRFRIYLFEGPVHAPGVIVDTYDITDADMFEAVRWAQERAGDRHLYAVALVRDERERPEAEGRQMSRGLVWLVGRDLNDPPTTEAEQRCVRRMTARRGRRVVLEEAGL
jgi:hypothetical protein